ncbi:MAG: helix-turn-helix transcriptional regulator [Alphaproteobacteria bacterium]
MPMKGESHAVEALASAVDHLGQAAFDEALLAWLKAMVAFDSALVLVYAERQRPKILVDGMKNPDRRNSAELYVGAAYLLDPFYLHALRLRKADVIRLRDIVPGDFAESDYMASYYRGSAIEDEINFLIPLERMTYAICLERSIRQPAFSPGDLDALRTLLPLLAALVRRHVRLAGAAFGSDGPDREHLRLESVLADFGRDLLTPREREVVGMMLAGHALAQISEALKISPETARVHRRNIYEKLGISSLAELFSRALTDLVADRFPGRS